MKQSPIWKTQPVFISSTFTDMMLERDVLRDFVFKEIEEKLYDRRVRLEPIDLRWGVETNSEQDQEQKELMVNMHVAPEIGLPATVKLPNEATMIWKNLPSVQISMEKFPLYPST